MNFTLPFNGTSYPAGFTPSNDCFSWCTVQHVVNYNNMEVSSLWFIATALILIIIAEIMLYKPAWNKYASRTVYGAKIALFCFFWVYFIILRLRLYYYAHP